MEPEGSSPYPQVPAIRPYPEPTPSRPHDPLQLPLNKQPQCTKDVELNIASNAVTCTGTVSVAGMKYLACRLVAGWKTRD